MNFREIALRRVLKLPCQKCGKPVQRTIKAWQTINPFNTLSDGRVKTAQDIQRELPGKLDALESVTREKGVVCRQCDP